MIMSFTFIHPKNYKLFSFPHYHDSSDEFELDVVNAITEKRTLI